MKNKHVIYKITFRESFTENINYLYNKLINNQILLEHYINCVTEIDFSLTEDFQ